MDIAYDNIADHKTTFSWDTAIWLFGGGRNHPPPKGFRDFLCGCFPSLKKNFLWGGAYLNLLAKINKKGGGAPPP